MNYLDVFLEQEFGGKMRDNDDDVDEVIHIVGNFLFEFCRQT